MPMDNVSVSEWSLEASAGMTVVLEFTSDAVLSTLSIFTGGTVDDVDDLTGATEHPGVLSGGGLVATVPLAVPTGQPTALRLAVNGTVQTVGQLWPSIMGSTTPDAATVSLVTETRTFALSVLGVLGAGGPGGVGAYTHTQASSSLVWTVQHNLGYRPAGIQVYDTDEGDVDGLIAHVNTNVLTITFTKPRRGVAYLS